MLSWFEQANTSMYADKPIISLPLKLSPPPSFFLQDRQASHKETVSFLVYLLSMDVNNIAVSLFEWTEEIQNRSSQN